MKTNAMRFPLLLGAAFGITLCSTIPASAADWPKWGGPNRNGIATEKEIAVNWPASGPKQLWKVNTGKSYSAVTVQNGRVFTMGSAEGVDTVFCFDAATGKTVWTYKTPHAKRAYMGDPNPTATTSTPVLEGGRVYVLGREGIAVCLNATDGKPLWKKDIAAEAKAKLPQWGFAGSPVIDDDRVYYNVGHHGVALQKLSGSVLWKSDGGLAGYATPVLYRMGTQKGVAFYNGTGIVGVDSTLGKPYWEHTWKTRFDVNAADPIFMGEELFITAFGRAQRIKIDANKPKVVSEVRNMHNSFVSPVLIDGHLYGNHNGRLVCMDLKTDMLKWDMPNMGSGSLIAAGKYLIALLDRGELVVVEATPSKLTELARAKVLESGCWTQPTLANGRLYCRNTQGDVVCLDLKK